MKKTLTVVIALVLVVVMSVAGTVAYLTSTKTVTNTFTVGKVEITLDETDVDVYGSKDGETRVAENTYKLIPGHTYTKDAEHVSYGHQGYEPYRRTSGRKISGADLRT